MDIEYLIIGIVFLITAIVIIIYKFRYHTIKENEYVGFGKYIEFKIAVGLIVLSIYLISKEIKHLF